MRWMRATVAAAAAGALLGVAAFTTTASANNVPPPLQGIMLFTDIGTACPGFAPFIPGDPVADDGTIWFSGYFSWPPGEYLWFSSVDTNPGGTFRTDGSGVPPGYPGWMPTSDHTYRVIGKVTAEGFIFDDARVRIVRDDGATVSGDVSIQIDQNHGNLLTGWTSPPSCRFH